MFCPYCGAQMPDGTAVCTVCGNKLPASPRPQPVQPTPAQPYPSASYPGQSVQPPYPMQQAPVLQPKKKTNLVPILAIGGGAAVLVVILVVVLLIVLKGGDLPSMKYAGQTYSYGDITMLEPGMQEIGESTHILIRRDHDTGMQKIVMLSAREGSMATIGGLRVGDSYRKVTSKFKGISAEQYNAFDGTTIEGNPLERADYMLYIVDGKEYTSAEYAQATAEMMTSDYEALAQFRDNTFIISVRVEHGIVTGIYAGDYRAIFTLN